MPGSGVNDVVDAAVNPRVEPSTSVTVRRFPLTVRPL